MVESVILFYSLSGAEPSNSHKNHLFYSELCVMFNHTYIFIYFFFLVSLNVDAAQSDWENNLERLQSLPVLIKETADSCILKDNSFEEQAKVDNRFGFLIETGRCKEAIECGLSLMNAEDPIFSVLEGLSICYSKLGECEKAANYAELYKEEIIEDRKIIGLPEEAIDLTLEDVYGALSQCRNLNEKTTYSGNFNKTMNVE